MAGILPLVFAFYKKHFFSILTFYLVLSVVTNVVLTITSYLKIPNHSIYNIYLLASYLALGLFYIKQGNRFLKKVVIVSFLLFFSDYTYEIINKSITITAIQIANISYCVWSLTLFFIMLNNSEHIKNKNNFEFIKLINASIFIYNTTTIILFFQILNLIGKNSWFIHNYIEGSTKLLIAYAFWKLPKKQQ